MWSTTPLILLVAVCCHFVIADEYIISADKVAKMSSTNRGFIANYGNDGTVDQYNRHCAQTRVGTNQWWKVDLEYRYRIARIVIYTSGYERRPMSNFRIETSRDGHHWQLCNFFKGPTRIGQPIHLLCAAELSRELRIRQPGKGALTLCGVIVFGERDAHVDDFKEIAATDPSWASKAKGDNLASLANNWGSNQCYISAGSAVNLFWAVDLVFPYSLDRVAIYRGDNAAGTIKILYAWGKGHWKVCEEHVALNSPITIARCHAAATKVKLVTTSKFRLNLCQVRVYGVRIYPKNQPIKGDYLIAVDKPTKQSSTFKGFGAQLASDGFFNGLQCSATLDKPNQWWEVDLLEHYEVDAVTVYTSARNGDQLGPFKVQVSQTGGKWWRTCATFSKKSFNNNAISLLCPASYVNAVRIVQARKSPLVLCEVVVYGIRDQKVEDYKEIALYRPAFSEPKPLRGHFSHLANDNVYNQRCFWSSSSKAGAYWQVQLQFLSHINRIAFSFPRSLTKSIRIRMEVRDGPDGNWIHCGDFNSPVRSSNLVVRLCKAFGTDVRIRALNNVRLGLCEVDVWGLRWFDRSMSIHSEM